MDFATPPTHLAQLELARLKPRYKDLRPQRRPIVDTLRRRMFACSPRGVIAIAAAISEWALWRVDGHHESSTAALVEALWVRAVHPSYLLPWTSQKLHPPSDPGWENPAQSTYWHVEHLNRLVIENMIGYLEVEELYYWCMHVLPKDARPKFDRWLLATAKRVAELSPGTPDTFTCCTEDCPDPDLQAHFEWGEVVTRDELDGRSRPNIDAWLRSIDPNSNPFLCPRKQVARNRCWREFMDEIPALRGKAYTFDSDPSRR
jgi:hypothetical protein